MVQSNISGKEHIFIQRKERVKDIAEYLADELSLYLEKYSMSVEQLEKKEFVSHVMLLRSLNGGFNHSLYDLVSMAQAIGKDVYITFDKPEDWEEEIIEENIAVEELSTEDVKVEEVKRFNFINFIKDREPSFKRTGIPVLKFLYLSNQHPNTLNDEERAIIEQVNKGEWEEAIKNKSFLEDLKNI